MINTEN